MPFLQYLTTVVIPTYFIFYLYHLKEYLKFELEYFTNYFIYCFFSLIIQVS